ncbi:efflux RND transporter periplasmic adaptor subunit [Opitutus terrae]|uniref:Efflux transporter, RND family, MFP subunit n=1 Tax=Opitutus terrae (strain DSM 11246 / JCM 15787 / PB90-1) TaxID=452637 RepID=B1ZTQ1_OPITP|nr:efflux RND transporter periplasmic adaptor subunit [Opitutus terrae]ACB74837.1 efflux transporter, RND family, MFP subunit [Opitutus terrae PB90-1]
MKSPRVLLLIVSLAASGLIAPEVAEFLVPHAHAAEQQLYTCGMHPQVIKSEPGNCPICGMKLTPIRGNNPGAAATAGDRKVKFYKSTMIPGEVSPNPGKDSMGMDRVPVYEDEFDAASAITIDPITIQKMNLKTALVQTGPVRRTIRAVGTVGFSEPGLIDITTKYEGWIEKLFVNATWTRVKAGTPLFEIYSPDLYNAQLNFLVALRSEGSEGGPLTNAARARLQLFDVPAAFITELAQAGEARRKVVYRAPVDGVVIEKPAVQGMMVRPGERIFRLADLSTVWVNAQIYEKDLAFVHEGQHAVVRTSFGQEREFHGEVEVLIPEIVNETRTAQARLVLDNPDRALKPGMFVDVRFEAELAPSAVLVPDLAVLRSGERNTVFVARDGGTFEAREVKLGARTQDNFFAVRSGLAAGERVVTSGQFLLDSESQLRAAIQKMIRATQAGGGTAAASTPAAQGAGSGPSSPQPAPATAAAPAMPAEAQPALKQLAFASADAAAALAADDLSAYRQQLPALRTAVAGLVQAAPQSGLAKYKGALPEPTDLESARQAFEPLSTAVADLARASHLQHTAGLRIFECPMSPVLGKARWLQRESGTKNPFFGSDMPRCGEQIDGPSAATAPSADAGMKLPAGHPPIRRLAGTKPPRAAMSGSDFLRSQIGVPVALATPADETAHASGGCRGCGMSAAATAAGEPCEHEVFPAKNADASRRPKI